MRFEKKDSRADFSALICSLFIAFGCFIAILWWLQRTALWEDEIIAISHSNQPFPLFFIEVLRNDIHPPLYFLQLKLWRDIGFHSDAAILFNSVVCAFLSLLIMFWLARKVYDKKAAFFAAAFLAVLPIFAYGAGNLRMYGLIPGLALLVWYANRQWFVTEDRKWLFCIVLLESAVSYIHAIEFFFVGFFALAASAECVFGIDATRGRHRVLLKWILSQLAVLILIAPLMASAVIRGSEATAPSSLLSSLTEPGALVAGWGPSSIMSLRIAGLIIFLFLTAAAMTERQSRIRTIVVPIAALVIAIAVSMAAKPMIKVPVFASNLLPFLALGAGAGVARHGYRYLRVGAYACLLALGLAAYPLMRYQNASDAYLQTGNAITAQAQPGDIVVIPNVSVYWGVMRYAVGEQWGKPLEIMPLKPNAQWEGLLNKLGPNNAAMLGLRPVSDHVIARGITYVIGEDARHLTATAQRVWVVQRNGYKVDVQLGAPFMKKSLSYPSSDDLALSLYTRDDKGEPVARHPMRTSTGAEKNNPVNIAP